MDEGFAGGVGAFVVHSFVVRVLGDRNLESQRWQGVVTDTATGERAVWRRPSDVARFIDRRLGERAQRGEGAAMTGPTLTTVLTDVLAVLSARLPVPSPALPDPNVTVERISERLVGLGNQRGTEVTHPLGRRTLRGGRLDARVRFQLWGATAAEVDTAVLVLQSDLLDDRETLRQAGFLRFKAAETTLAERVDSVNGWRKTTSFDVLYEYQYVDTDDADSLIAAIPVTLDPERTNSPDREVQILTDEMVRWDNEVAPSLRIHGPATVRRLSALAFVPATPIGGHVVLARRSDPPGPLTHMPDLATFLRATGGPTPITTDADVTLTPAGFFAGIGPSGEGLALGDWDQDGTTDSYAGFDRRLDDPLELRASGDVLTVTFQAPPGPSTALDQTAVVYLRVNTPD